MKPLDLVPSLLVTSAGSEGTAGVHFQTTEKYPTDLLKGIKVQIFPFHTWDLEWGALQQ